MRIIDRYIVKEFLFPFVWCIAVFIYLYIIIDLFAHLDDIIKRGIALNLIFDYYASFIPVVFVQTAPMASLVSTVYSLGKLNRYNELMAMRAGGLSPLRILLPLIVLGLIISGIVFFVNEEILPEASSKSTNLKEKMSAAKEVPLSPLNHIVFYGRQGRLYYIGSFNPELNELKDITILEHDENRNIKGRIFARSGKYLNNVWIFYDCIIYSLTKQGEIIGEPAVFKEKPIDIKEKPGDFLKEGNLRLEFMRYAKLKEYIDRFGAGANKAIKGLQVELNYKIAFPCMSLITILIGSSFALKRRHSGLWGGLGITIAIGFLYYWLMSVSLALGKADILSAPVSAWLANLLFGGMGLLFLLRQR